MAKLIVVDEARKEFANLCHTFDEVNQQLQTKFNIARTVHNHRVYDRRRVKQTHNLSRRHEIKIRWQKVRMDSTC
ncbi:hypothetical protein KSP40_PGU017781 [Platanthera guangdongensis]|uniref:Ribosomal protein S21 n=1 Tax=Platanthera guangdongensis TaxID=2320717 RepID=A0ABR2LZD5_9ASPA